MRRTSSPLTRSEMLSLLKDAARRSIKYLESIAERSVFPLPDSLVALAQFREPLPEKPSASSDVLAALDVIGSPATVATTGGRYFGFVVGGALPVTVAAGWLATAWDQNAGLEIISPVASVLEEVVLRWLLDLFSLPSGTGAGFVTGGTSACFTALAAARHALLARIGWDVESQGLFGAPLINVIVGDEVHVSVLKSLAMLGLGRERVIRVPVDSQGAMRPDSLPTITTPTIVCLQAGNVDSGAFDPAEEICEMAHTAGAWVHIEGAFGLWACASPRYSHLTRGISEADSWSTDAHKTLNVPYDSGIAFVKDAAHLRAAMSVNAPYLVRGDEREPNQFTPEMSRRARGIEMWAALRSLGRSGVAHLIDRMCHCAALFADRLREAGYEILNEVSFNQVLVSFGSDDNTRRTVGALQREGTCWCAGTVWHGRVAMRISVSSWATTEEDVERCVKLMTRLASNKTGPNGLR